MRIGFYDRSGAGSMRYELTDHLGNVRVGLVVNNGQVIMAEAHDHYPHGMPLPGRNTTSPAAGAYAYQGKENMTATGMLDFDLRDYDAQLGRWVVCDPMMQHFSPYLAMGNNTVMGVDPTGGYTGIIGGESYVNISNQYANELLADQFFQESQQRFNAQTGQGNEYASFGPSGGLNADGTFRDISEMIHKAGSSYVDRIHGPEIITIGGKRGWKEHSPEDGYKCIFVGDYWANNLPKTKELSHISDLYALFLEYSYHPSHAVRDAFNSNIGRITIPDALYLSIGVSLFHQIGGANSKVFGGGNATGGYIIATRGPDAFKIHRFADAGGGPGLSAGGTVQWGGVHYLGSDVNEFRIRMVAGNRAELGGGLSVTSIASVGMGFQYAETEKSPLLIRNAAISVGVRGDAKYGLYCTYGHTWVQD